MTNDRRRMAENQESDKHFPILLSTAYFAPVNYYARILAHQPVFLEQFEHFQKQTYRNRCVILGPNGALPLVVPVAKGRIKKIKIKDLKISYHEDWQRNHWRTLFSSYNSSPFFEFYHDEIYPCFQKKEKFLFDLNLKVHQIIAGLLEIDGSVTLTENFEKIPDETLNLREMISPKNKSQKDENFNPVYYTQVFTERHGFIGNLSILDLLFNEGPNSINILEASLQKE